MVSFSGVKSLVAFPTFGECFLLCSRSTRIPRFPNLNAESPSDIHVWHGYVWVTTNTPQAQGIGPPTSNPNTSWPLKVRNSVGKSVGDKFGHVKNAWFGTRLWISIHQESWNIFTTNDLISISEVHTPGSTWRRLSNSFLVFCIFQPSVFTEYP